jgi:hypothetical protein
MELQLIQVGSLDCGLVAINVVLVADNVVPACTPVAIKVGQKLA